MISEPAILTRGLSKFYGDAAAVHALDLTVERNRITAFLGRNGAGKTTTIKMLLGMIRPTAGSGTVLGKQITSVSESRELRQRVAYVAEDKPIYGFMTVEQTIRFARSFYSDWRVETEKRLAAEFELPLTRKVKTLSKGMRTKLALLLAFARQPELLILDEPSEGLDPVGTEYLLESIVRKSAEGACVFFSSHQISEVERIADHVCILEKGRLLVDGELDEFRQSYRRVDVVFADVAPEENFSISGVEKIRTNGKQMSVFVSRNAEGVVDRARALNAVSVEVSPVGLRDIFLQSVKEN